MPIDYSKYPPNWRSEIRPRIMTRANSCCESCGLQHHSTVWSVAFSVKNNKGRYTKQRIWFRDEDDAIRESAKGFDLKPVKVVLTIAHLDHDEENHEVSDDRLKALCQSCHLRLDADEKWRRQLVKMGL